MEVRIIRGRATDSQLGGLTAVPVGIGLPAVADLWDEITEYMDILLGRKPCPIDSPYLAMSEVATAYHARAQEIDAMIHAAERENVVLRGSALYRFRTGELRAFIELSKKCAELGSRRLTQEQLLFQQRLES